jgi:hypothetical protein
MDDFIVCYLDDILIYLEDPAQHECQGTKVFIRKESLLSEDPVASGSNVLPLVASITSKRKSSH